MLEEKCCTPQAQPVSMGTLQPAAGLVPLEGCSSQVASSASWVKPILGEQTQLLRFHSDSDVSCSCQVGVGEFYTCHYNQHSIFYLFYYTAN